MKSSIFCIAFLVSCCGSGCRTTASRTADISPRSATKAASSSGISGVQAAWLQLAGGSSVLARVITTANDCPALSVDGAPLALHDHTAPSTDFAVHVCETLLPVSATNVSLGAQAMVLPKAQPKRIVILGDSGCRIKGSGKKLRLQYCDSADDWPLATIAASIAAAKPDLVIHVGDYHYREAPCPKGVTQCADAVIGDNWESWQQDFFTPALPLLESAPALFVRGNHELCARGGKGWFTLLDPHAVPASGCIDQTDPYWVSVGDHQVAVIDAADSTQMQATFDALAMPTTAPANALVWWVLHRPFLTKGADDEVIGKPSALPATWQQTGRLNAVFTGHQHRLAFNQFSNGTPPELINGNGGTQLEAPPNLKQAYVPIANSDYVSSSWFDFGFTTLDRVPTGWTVTAHNRSGAPVISCQMTESKTQPTNLACAALPAAMEPPPGGTAVTPGSDDNENEDAPAPPAMEGVETE